VVLKHICNSFVTLSIRFSSLMVNMLQRFSFRKSRNQRFHRCRRTKIDLKNGKYSWFLFIHVYIVRFLFIHVYIVRLSAKVYLVFSTFAWTLFGAFLLVCRLSFVMSSAFKVVVDVGSSIYLFRVENDTLKRFLKWRWGRIYVFCWGFLSHLCAIFKSHFLL